MTSSIYEKSMYIYNLQCSQSIYEKFTPISTIGNDPSHKTTISKKQSN
ncbi:11505_t:CDS:2 [Ambispora leptoticha]|uniref:11505_t:CDS:1 n=1 Tax=Ambispora leptoticha TaxID=144679 RepID=A0A9N9A8S6_9GLOM|nr:11505_t:CDS:2 [Ambispora leptoticha]